MFIESNQMNFRADIGLRLASLILEKAYFLILSKFYFLRLYRIGSIMTSNRTFLQIKFGLLWFNDAGHYFSRYTKKKKQQLKTKTIKQMISRTQN